VFVASVDFRLQWRILMSFFKEPHHGSIHQLGLGQGSDVVAVGDDEVIYHCLSPEVVRILFVVNALIGIDYLLT
jgi:hypothetical protein